MWALRRMQKSIFAPNAAGPCITPAWTGTRISSPEEKQAAASLWKYESSQPHGKISSETAKPGGNGIAAMLKVIGLIVYVIAGLVGLILVATRVFVPGLILLGSGFVSGTLFLGFGEIVRLLDVISKK